MRFTYNWEKEFNEINAKRYGCNSAEEYVKKFHQKSWECPYRPMHNITRKDMWNKLGKLEDIGDDLGIELITFLKGIDPDTCFMKITKDKQFYLCGDAYQGTFSKEGLLKFIQNLLFMYWALTKEELKWNN